MHLSRNQHPITGLVLMELMIALSLGLLLISILTEIYLTSQRSFQSQLALTEIQNNAKTAINLITTDIHQAGYIGCPKLTTGFPIIPYPPYQLSTSNKLTVSESEITSIHAEFPSAVLEEDIDEPSTLYVSKNIRFHPGDILIISDCKHAELFKANYVSSFGQFQKIISTIPLSFKYKKYAEISHLEINKFFVDKTGRKSPSGSSVFALYLKDIHQYKSELVDGINKIHFQQKDNGIEMELQLVSGKLTKTWYAYANVT